MADVATSPTVFVEIAEPAQRLASRLVPFQSLIDELPDRHVQVEYELLVDLASQGTGPEAEPPHAASLVAPLHVRWLRRQAFP